MKKLSHSLRSAYQIMLITLFSLLGASATYSIGCADITGFEFTNGSESVDITDGGSYMTGDLPSHFYIKLELDDNPGSVVFVLTDANGNEYEIIENFYPYTYPSGNSDWNMPAGTYTLNAEVYSWYQGYGSECDSDDITFTIMDDECVADAGTLMADISSLCLEEETTLSATPNGDSYVPDNYQTIYVLTEGDGLVIIGAGAEPTFTVNETGTYTIHTLVFDPSTLNLEIVVPGVTTGFDVNGLLIQGGGEICASLDVAGAPFSVSDPNAGTLTANEAVVCLDGEASISATPNNDSNVPDGYSTVYVLTQGDDLVIVGAGAEPSFEVSEGGMYTIHTLVYNPETLDLSIVVPGVTTGFDVNGLLVQGGGAICASLDVPGAAFTVEAPNAGTLTADASSLCLNDGVNISATPNGDSNVPDGYSTIYVLTEGEDLTILNAGPEPSFLVDEAGMYTIHTLVYNAETLDLGIVVLGETTGFDVNGLLVQGGGSICASLDVAGAQIAVSDPNAGTLTANEALVCLDGETSISATPNNDSNVPAGYATVYVLTQGEGLVIIGAGAEPSFTVNEGGMYTIHTLVYNPETLDLGIVVPGETTGFDVNGLLVQGGGSICASLDVPGAAFTVEDPNAGTLTADASNVELDGITTISASADGNMNVPDGYSYIYVLTMGEDLIIMNVNSEPTFDVETAGLYTIHTLVYNPATLDLGIVELGVTSGVTVFGLIVPGGGDICASLDVAGAPINVSEEACLADAGTLSAMESTLCLDGSASLEAMANGDSNVPTDYSTLYVLTKGSELVIVDAGAEPTFDVTESGDYTIHTLVYNPETLDLTIVEFGVTTGFQVNALLIQGGGNICASLDVPGAAFTVEAPDAGTLTALSSTVVLNNGSAQISASPNGDIMIPDGYSSIYVLTQGADLVIVNAGSEPTFTVEEAGLYTIHTLVYNAETLDLGIVELGVTTGVQVFQLIVPGGGDICASLDVMGAQITVEESDVCEAYSGTLYAQDPYQCIDNGSATLTASFNNEATIPDGYEIVYVLTNAYSLTILDAGASPEFEVESPGFYRIHSLVYDPNTLDLSIVQIGQTTGYDVYSLLIEGGGEICGSLNVPGAVFLALPSWICNWFNYNKNVSEMGDDMSIEKLIKENGDYASFEKSLIETNYSYTIAPNPASDKLIINIELIEAENMNYTLVDASGRVVLKGDINSKNAGTILLEVSDYPNGLYYINFSSEQRNFTEKIQIIH